MDQKPGLAPDTKRLIEKFITWTILGVIAWIVIIAAFILTLKFAQWVV